MKSSYPSKSDCKVGSHAREMGLSLIKLAGSSSYRGATAHLDGYVILRYVAIYRVHVGN